jgi:hypothetical protein
MNGRCLFFLPFFFSSVTSAQVAPTPAQIAEMQETWKSYVIRADGSTDPSGIPYAVVVERMFQRLATEQKGHGQEAFRQRLRARFSGATADIDRISEYASRTEEFAAEVYNDESRSLDQVCADFLATDWRTADAREVAETFEQVETRRLGRIDAHYNEALGALSPSARSALLSYMDTEVRGRMNWGGFDSVGLSIAAPEAFLWNKKLSCERWLSLPESAKTWKQVAGTQNVDSSSIGTQESVSSLRYRRVDR